MRNRALRLGLSVFIPCLWAFCPLSLSAQQSPSDSSETSDDPVAADGVYDHEAVPDRAVHNRRATSQLSLPTVARS